MKRFFQAHWSSFLKVGFHLFFYFFFAHQAFAAEPVSRITRGTEMVPFLLTNGLMALGFVALGWYFFKRS